MLHRKIYVLLIFSLMGCSANPVIPQARSIEIVDEKPDTIKCKYLGEIVGTQGNWFTGEFTSIINLVVGARNELRNKTYELGGNIVHIENMKNTKAWWLQGTSNTIVIGKAYKCPN